MILICTSIRVVGFPEITASRWVMFPSFVSSNINIMGVVERSGVYSMLEPTEFGSVGRASAA